MPPFSQPTIDVGDGQITIDAELLAPRLGLSIADLKANMAKGLVTGIAETGADEDAGRTRLTFRYRARVWRFVREPDGTLKEDPVRPAKRRAVTDHVNLHDQVRQPS